MSTESIERREGRREERKGGRDRGREEEGEGGKKGGREGRKKEIGEGGRLKLSSAHSSCFLTHMKSFCHLFVFQSESLTVPTPVDR